ncbi:MAG: putative nucleotidyltransferase substrate binding domain-containing protein [Alphaproteobacteria bacterium]
MLASNSATPLSALQAVAFDTETTGLDATLARLIQVGVVRIDGEKILETETYDTLVNPCVEIPKESTEIHGITNDAIKNAPEFVDILTDMEDFIGRSVIIGHNIGFDLAILKEEYARSGAQYPNNRRLDILPLARIVRPSLNSFSLDNLAKWLQVPIIDRHTAHGDALIAARIFVQLIPLLREQGIINLAQAEKSCRAFTDILESHERQGWTAPARRMPTELSIIARIDSFPFRHRVRDIMSRPPIVLDSSTNLKDIAFELIDKGVSSVFVSYGSSDMGIITERDLVRAIGSKDNGLASAGDIMSKPLKTIPDDVHVYRALGQMRYNNIRHLGVCDASGALVGALTTGDLVKQRADDAIILGYEIDTAPDVKSLAKAWARLPVVSTSLAMEKIPPLEISAIHSEELCALTKQAAELAEQRMLAEGEGKPPVGYTVLVLGSGGRGESMLTPDQDSAIIYSLDEETPEIDAWFAKFGAHLSDISNDAGVRYCDGGVMARNAHWRGGKNTWKKRIDCWIARAETADILNVDIFYDFRPVFGPTELAYEIWNYAYDHAHRSPGFLKLLAVIATNFKSPIGMFGNIKTDEGRINLKTSGMMAIVSCARLLALRHDIRECPTRRRLEALQQVGAYNKDDLANVIRAYEIMLSEMLEQQLLDIDAGVKPTNRIDLQNLTKARKRKLKWALSQVDNIVGHVGDPMAFG